MDRAERNELVEKNIGLVHACANKFRGKGAEYDDLFQAGCVGLIKAAENFDPERGFSFSTYAVPVILGEIKRIFRDGGSVKVGRALKEKARAAMREKDAQLAERLGSDVAQTAQLLNAAMPAVSLTACTDDGEGQIDLPVESPENAASELIALREVIAMLPDRDREMISLRYYRGMTQSRTAELLGMSQVQVSRREKAVLALLRRNLSA